MGSFVLTGKVISEESQSGVPGVMVQVSWTTSGQELGSTITNEEGGFQAVFEEGHTPRQRPNHRHRLFGKDHNIAASPDHRIDGTIPVGHHPKGR